jgi:hypothetical protein
MPLAKSLTSGGISIIFDPNVEPRRIALSLGGMDETQTKGAQLKLHDRCTGGAPA